MKKWGCISTYRDHFKRTWEQNLRDACLSFHCCGCSHEYAQTSEEACLQHPPEWEKEELVGPQWAQWNHQCQLPLACPESDQRRAEHPEACDCPFPGSMPEITMARQKGRHMGICKRKGTANARKPEKVTWMRRMRILYLLHRRYLDLRGLTTTCITAIPESEG